jgi:hypothetical protein
MDRTGMLAVLFVISGVFRLNHDMWSRLGCVAGLDQPLSNLPSMNRCTNETPTLRTGRHKQKIPELLLAAIDILDIAFSPDSDADETAARRLISAKPYFQNTGSAFSSTPSLLKFFGRLTGSLWRSELVGTISL